MEIIKRGSLDDLAVYFKCSLCKSEFIMTLKDDEGMFEVDPSVNKVRCRCPVCDQTDCYSTVVDTVDNIKENFGIMKGFAEMFSMFGDGK